MAFSGALPLAASATTNLFAAREQMAFTLAFHIVLACLGVALPAMVLVAHWIIKRSGAEDDDGVQAEDVGLHAACARHAGAG
ncbi:MAG: hypothetical protein J0H06_07235, partial [Actinobacteria bacterium]|nr:hypothetical protein [Actinomycetota bacterium]